MGMKISIREVFNSTFWRQLTLIASGLGLYFLAAHIHEIWGQIGAFFGLLTPFIVGFVLAFLLNGLLVFLEKNTFLSIKNRKKRRLWSLVMTLVITLGVIIILFSFMLPQLRDSLTQLQSKMSDYQQAVQNFLNNYFPFIDASSIKIDSFAQDFFNNGGFDRLLSYSGQAASSVINLFIGLVVAIYILYNKELYARQTKKICLRFFARCVGIRRDQSFALCQSHFHGLFLFQVD